MLEPLGLEKSDVAIRYYARLLRTARGILLVVFYGAQTPTAAV